MLEIFIILTDEFVALYTIDKAKRRRAGSGLHRSLPCRRSLAGTRVAPQQLPYPPANTLIVPGSPFCREAGLSLFGPSIVDLSISFPAEAGFPAGTA